MPSILLMIAEAEAGEALPEVTGPLMLAGLAGLFTFVGSVVMVIRAGMRLQDGKLPIPAAQRRPLHVPLPVAILGVCLAVFLAMMAITAPEGIEKPAAEAQVAEQAVGEPDDGAATDAAIESEPDGTPNPADVAQRGEEIIIGTLGMFGAFLLIFGTLVAIAQDSGPGRSVAVANESPSGRSGPFEPEEGVPPDNPFVMSLYPDAPESDSVSEEGGPLPRVVEPWNLFTELKFAGTAFLLAFAPTLVVRLVMVSMLPEPKSHPMLEVMKEGTLPIQTLALMMFTAVVAAPVVEELVYRVVVLGGLMKRRTTLLAVIVSSVLFSFAHGFPDSISLLPLAFILGYTYVQRRSYRTVILVHCMFNAFNMGLALLTMGAEPAAAWILP